MSQLHPTGPPGTSQGSHHWASSSTLPLSLHSEDDFNDLTTPVVHSPSALAHHCPFPGPLQATSLLHSFSEACGTKAMRSHPHWHLAPAPSAMLPSYCPNSQLTMAWAYSELCWDKPRTSHVALWPYTSLKSCPEETYKPEV